jgi:hypothetical protein
MDKLVNRAPFGLHKGKAAADAGNIGRSAQVFPRPSLSPELNRMLSAAVVSAGFRRMLLDDPAAALARGYGGEVFDILPDERAQVLAIRANTLAEFAAQLLERLWFERLDVRRQGIKGAPVNGVDHAMQKRETPAQTILGAGESRQGGPFLNAPI